MQLISINEKAEVNGGFTHIIRGLQTYATVFGFPAVIIGAINEYDDFGSKLGQQVFDATNPDPLGQMVYTKEDFGIQD